MRLNNNTIKDTVSMSIDVGMTKPTTPVLNFNVIAGAIYEHYDMVLNFFTNRAINAFAKIFNAKIK